MLAKSTEKMGEYLVVTVLPAIGLLIINFFFKEADSEMKEVLAPLAGVLIGGLVFAVIWGVSRLKSSQYKPGITFQPKGVVRPDGYLLSTVRLTVYGTLLFTAGSLLLSFLAGFLLAIALFGFGIDPESDLFMAAAGPTLIFGQAITAFLVSRWIGSRADRRGWLISILVIVMGVSLISLIDWLFGEGFSLDVFLLNILLIGLFAVLGNWRGVKTREAGYLWYLLSNLPPNSREPIESLLYEEVLAQVTGESASTSV